MRPVTSSHLKPAESKHDDPEYRYGPTDKPQLLERGSSCRARNQRRNEEKYNGVPNN